MLVMDVPTDINQIDPKQLFGLTGRQFLCMNGVVLCAVRDRLPVPRPQPGESGC